jgi:hypothetical protein
MIRRREADTASDLTATVNVLFGGTVALQLVPYKTGYVLVTVRFGNYAVTMKGTDKMAYTVSVDNPVEFQVEYFDAHDNPAVVDGEVTWSLSDPTFGTIAVDATNSMLATVTPSGTLGNCQIAANADADLGTGVKNITTLGDLTFVAGEAVAGRISPVAAP